MKTLFDNGKLHFSVGPWCGFEWFDTVYGPQVQVGFICIAYRAFDPEGWD